MFNAAKKFNGCTKFKYDKKGNFLKSYSCSPDDKNDSSLVYNYTFDSRGNIVKREEIINDVVVKTTITDLIYW